MTQLKNIPCNVITGFLGSGKTTAILHLLKQKPANERWAVLVNEFGQIGIDGKVISSQHSYIKEIPGGCMCCSAGIPMQVAVNQLVKESRPHRLLIEPTGIGHPQQIIKQLSTAPFNQLLDMRACITLLDPRQLYKQRYISNEHFINQLKIADVLVANKTDLCSENDQKKFFSYLKHYHELNHGSGWVQQGKLSIKWLDLPHNKVFTAKLLQPIIEQNEDVYQTASWEYSADKIFNYHKLLALITNLQAERFKALVKTDEGNYYINSVFSNISILKHRRIQLSQIEIITAKIIDPSLVKQQLTECLYIRSC